MKLIISEKPSTAQTIAHAVGAREKIYGEGKEFCYKGSGYYVVNARGHLYGLGLPQDYSYSKLYSKGNNGQRMCYTTQKAFHGRYSAFCNE